MTNYFDCNPVDCQENWEYLGQEADGVFETRIEFDESAHRTNGCQRHERGAIVVLAAASKPEARHQH